MDGVEASTPNAVVELLPHVTVCQDRRTPTTGTPTSSPASGREPKCGKFEVAVPVVGVLWSRPRSVQCMDRGVQPSSPNP